MQQLNFTFTIDEANMILNALGQQPYTQVFQLVQKINMQAATQLSPNGAKLTDAQPKS